MTRNGLGHCQGHVPMWHYIFRLTPRHTIQCTQFAPNSRPCPYLPAYTMHLHLCCVDSHVALHAPVASSCGDYNPLVPHAFSVRRSARHRGGEAGQGEGGDGGDAAPQLLQLGQHGQAEEQGAAGAGVGAARRRGAEEPPEGLTEEEIAARVGGHVAIERSGGCARPGARA